MRGIYLNRKLIKVCFNNFILLHIVLVISHLHCFIVGYKLECNARGQSIYWTICKKIPFISPSLCLCRCSYDRPSRVCGIWRATVVYIIYAILIAYCKILKAKTQLMLFCIIYSDLFNKIQFSILFYSICLSHGIVVSREKSYCWVGGSLQDYLSCSLTFLSDSTYLKCLAILNRIWTGTISIVKCMSDNLNAAHPLLSELASSLLVVAFIYFLNGYHSVPVVTL